MLVMKSPIQNCVQSIRIIIQYNKMGQSINTTQKQFDYLRVSGIHDQQFYLQDVKSIKLRQTKKYQYYWIDPKIYNGQNQKYFRSLQNHFQIECFTSIESLKNDLEDLDEDIFIKVICAASLNDEDYKYLQHQSKVYQVILFCQNQQRAKLLMANCSKIINASFNIMNLTSNLKQLQESEMSQLKLTSALFMNEDDTSVINKYRLNYSCFIKSFNRDKAKKDFVSLALQIFPQQKAKINQFIKTYDTNISGEELSQQVWKWTFENNFFWNLIDIFPKTTTDPKRLGYMRLPFKDLYLSIYNKHHSQRAKQHTFYVILELSQGEKQNLGQSLENYVIFTTFIKGYSEQSVAMKEFKSKSQNCFLFDVVFSKKKFEGELDFGFYCDLKRSKGQDVIFNIYNFFKIDEISMKQRRGTLVYGSLAELYYKRNDPITRNKITQKQECLLRNFDFAQDLSRKVADQANLLQMSGNVRQSIKIYKSKIQEVRKTNVSQQILDEYSLRIGDAYKMSDQYYKAEKQYLSIQSTKYKAVVAVHLAELYFTMEKYDKLQKILQNLENNTEYLKENGFVEDAFKAQNYVALWLMRRGKLKQANKKFKALQAQTATYYDYKFEGIPLVHDIFRNMALCQSKMNNHTEALNMLSTTKGWQKICQGTTANLAITQRMIQQIHQSQGNNRLVEESKKNVEKIQKAIIKQDQNYLKKTKVIPNVNTSFVQIDI